LSQARERRRAIAPLTETTPDLSIEDAYAIAQRLLAARQAAGARLIGHKIGLTSRAVQQQLGVHQPDYRALLDVMAIADSASSAGFVLGGRRRPLDELDVTAVEVALWRGEEVVERGDSSAVLGDPCAAVAWLANALAPRGARLEAGHVVLSGACTRMVAATAGDAFRGDFGALGEVRLAVAQASR
jgi:2-keto-4-pentenoate hydratase